LERRIELLNEIEEVLKKWEEHQSDQSLH
jgi:hypothetical protein